jgi:hypothetical protein
LVQLAIDVLSPSEAQVEQAAEQIISRFNAELDRTEPKTE